MKVWTISSFKGYISGVFLDRELAIESLEINDVLEEWEPEITDNARITIKEFARNLT